MCTNQLWDRYSVQFSYPETSGFLVRGTKLGGAEEGSGGGDVEIGKGRYKYPELQEVIPSCCCSVMMMRMMLMLMMIMIMIFSTRSLKE